MAVYLCRISDPSGAIRCVQREATDESELKRILSSEPGFVLSWTRQVDAASVGGRYPEKTVLEFTRTLAVLLQAGLSLEGALEIAGEAFGDGKARNLALGLRERILKGETFSRSLEAYGRTFAPVYRGMVRIGERTGHLEPMFAKIAAYMDEQKRLKDKVRGAMVYPCLVLGIVGIMILGVVFFLVPGLTRLFAQMGTGLPPQTLAGLAVMNWLGFAVLLSLGLGLGLALTLRRTRARGGKPAEAMDGFLLRLPLLGTYLVLSEGLSFSFAMETLVGAGISLEDALLESTGVVRNMGMRADILAVREGIISGTSLSRALGGRKSLPREFSRWATVGEKTGRVEGIFGQTKAFFQYELDRWTTRFMGLVEPSLIIFVGAILVTVVLLFIIPFLTSFTAII